MARDRLPQKVRSSLLFQSEDGGYRICGGFVYAASNRIQFEKTDEVRNERSGMWEDFGGLSLPFNLLGAKMVRVELEEIIRYAEHPRDENWRLVQLSWKPTILVADTTVGVEGARLLLSQLNDAILEAEMVGEHKRESRKRKHRKTVS